MPLRLRTENITAHQVVGAIRVFRAREFSEEPRRKQNPAHVRRREPRIGRGLENDIAAEGVAAADAHQCRTVRLTGRIGLRRIETLVPDDLQQGIALPLIVADVAVRAGAFHRDGDLLPCGYILRPQHPPALGVLVPGLRRNLFACLVTILSLDRPGNGQTRVGGKPRVVGAVGFSMKRRRIVRVQDP